MEKVTSMVSQHGEDVRFNPTQEPDSKRPAKRYHSSRPATIFDCPLAELAQCPGCDQVKLQKEKQA